MTKFAKSFSKKKEQKLIEKGYIFSGHYFQDKDEAKAKAADLRREGVQARLLRELSSGKITVAEGWSIYTKAKKVTSDKQQRRAERRKARKAKAIENLTATRMAQAKAKLSKMSTAQLESKYKKTIDSEYFAGGLDRAALIERLVEMENY